jgi:polyisoprenoid-binding protein YceI
MAHRRRRWIRWGIAGLVVVALLAVGGPYIYIHFIEGPAPTPLALPNANKTPAGTGSVPLNGTWTVGSGSQAGYRVQEVLFGQNHTAVGRTSAVTGEAVIVGNVVTSGSFNVDLTTVKSDQALRDAQFQGRIMNTAAYPDATFKLSQPIDLGSMPAVNKTITEQATGSLAMHGTARSVTFTIEARYTGSLVQVSGSIPVTFADWNIPNPSFAGTVTTEDHGVVEFLVDLHHQG